MHAEEIGKMRERLELLKLKVPEGTDPADLHGADLSGLDLNDEALWRKIEFQTCGCYLLGALRGGASVFMGRIPARQLSAAVCPLCKFGAAPCDFYDFGLGVCLSFQPARAGWDRRMELMNRLSEVPGIVVIPRAE